MAVPLKPDTTDLHLRPFADYERDFNVRRRDGADFGAHRRELVAVFSLQLLYDNFGVLDLGWIVLRLGRETNFVGLETLKNVALGNCVYAGVRNGPNARAFLDVNVQDPALRGRLTLKPDVLKKTGVPQGVEIALNGGLVVDVPWLTEDVGADNIGRHGAVSVH